MNEQDWIKLCKNIFEKKCILLIGADFPVEIMEAGAEKSTSFSGILSGMIVDELVAVQKRKLQQMGLSSLLPPEAFRMYAKKELAQLATEYINSIETDKKICRESLELLVGNHLEETTGTISSACFDMLAALPFTFIVDTNYSNYFYNRLQKNNKSPRKAYYNFKGDKIDILKGKAAGPDESLGSEYEPFIFNLFGSIEDTSSLVISENDMIQFIINLISRNPGLPANIKTELSNTEKCFLFMGFGMQAKNWYFRILLNALESGNKERMSYALECLGDVDNNQDPTILFFRDELKVTLHHCDNKSFIKTLTEHYAKYEEKRVDRNKEVAVPADAPKAFISYKSEDYETANKIYLRLRSNGIDAWLDKERLSGNWSEMIKSEIHNSNAFLLIQSRNLKQSPVNYVNVEIREALDRARYYQREEDYFFPSYIDSYDSVLSSPEILSEIQSINLSSIELVDRLSKDIKRSYERNKTIKSNLHS